MGDSTTDWLIPTACGKWSLATKKAKSPIGLSFWKILYLSTFRISREGYVGFIFPFKTCSVNKLPKPSLELRQTLEKMISLKLYLTMTQINLRFAGKFVCLFLQVVFMLSTHFSRYLLTICICWPALRITHNSYFRLIERTRSALISASLQQASLAIVALWFGGIEAWLRVFLSKNKP